MNLHDDDDDDDDSNYNMAESVSLLVRFCAMSKQGFVL